MNVLIADSGATKCQWTFIANNKVKHVYTIGISPYFLNQDDIIKIIENEVLKKLKHPSSDKVFFYGTGLSNAINAKIIKQTLVKTIKTKVIEVNTDILAAARALCGNEKGIACILGTGSNSCFYDGKKIVTNRAGLGYVLGDEGSGAYLGKKVVQYYLYKTFDEELQLAFEKKFETNAQQILENVYKKPLANRYLANFAIFLAENRGHFMIENIIEDGLNDFFFVHLQKYNQSWKHPIHFVGSVAYGFEDVLKNLCQQYGFVVGNIIAKPMDGLIKFHK
jgi:N-acetylglucosamine kinase-like BadF-type ATPase